MLNVVFLIFLFLAYAIEFVSIYKYFQYHQRIKAILLLLFSVSSLILTNSYFFTRNALLFNEIEWLLEGVKHQNLYAIAIAILNFLLLGGSIGSYMQILSLERKKIGAK